MLDVSSARPNIVGKPLIPNIFAPSKVQPTYPNVPHDSFLLEEEKKEDMDQGDGCPYCNKPISPKDENAGNVNMFLGTECYHRFHISCFKSYAKTKMTTPKNKVSGNADIEF